REPNQIWAGTAFREKGSMFWANRPTVGRGNSFVACTFAAGPPPKVNMPMGMAQKGLWRTRTVGERLTEEIRNPAAKPRQHVLAAQLVVRPQNDARTVHTMHPHRLDFGIDNPD